LSKQFTCAAVLVLAEHGELDVDEPISRWIDDAPNAWKSITIHHLMTHTAGLLHWPDLPQEIHTEPPPLDELLAMFMKPPLLHEPGATYSYSSPGYVLLALIVERCSSTPYKQLLHDEVFAPLEMTSTFAGDGAGHDSLALGYRDGELVPSMALEATDIGAGDVWSTVRDLATWDRAIVDGTILSEDSRRRMFTPHVAMPVEVEGIEFDGYGYGWCLGSIVGHRLVFHTGGNLGYRSVNAILPDDDARLIVLTNDEMTDPWAFAFELMMLAVDDTS
jgi:CubicO group peptidase (beta-lactamase class C family)